MGSGWHASPGWLPRDLVRLRTVRDIEGVTLGDHIDDIGGRPGSRAQSDGGRDLAVDDTLAAEPWTCVTCGRRWTAIRMSARPAIPDCRSAANASVRTTSTCSTGSMATGRHCSRGPSMPGIAPTGAIERGPMSEEHRREAVLGPEATRYDKFMGSDQGLPTEVRSEIWRGAHSILSHGPTASHGTEKSTGVAIGFVQSGKTTSFTALITLAVDSGYRIVIAMLGSNNLLLEAEFGSPDQGPRLARTPRLPLAS